MTPRISVIVVSDYGGPGPKNWAEERTVLEAFAAQDLAEPFQIILVDHERNRARCPAELTRIAPHTTVLFTPHTRASDLKNAAFALCDGALVALVDADCVPAPDWLRLLVRTLDGVPDVDVVSGRTTYGQSTSLRRVLALLDRAWMDTGCAGPIGHISNNGALYRHELLAQFPYPDVENAFLVPRVRDRAMFASGIRAYFEPRAAMAHAFHGLGFAIDVRRNLAFADGYQYRPARSARTTHTLLWRTLVALTRDRFATEWRDCLRVGRHYLRWYDWPLALGLLVALRLFEAPAALAALRGAPRLARTSFR